ncbi:hypothetical protein B0H14DRAFT_3521885 [Mycena olivaceomarginata]|nr:hypothetical protein B0H14DRAFT_3530207 [Mycena olivaceomarginata]KAJ7717753.1 hypothetical protein B0H14DRAFT_3521885 [Mycena olivaceomarginata]
MGGASTHANVRRNLPEAEESRHRHEYSGFPAEAVLKPACRSLPSPPSPPEPNKCFLFSPCRIKRAKRAIREGTDLAPTPCPGAGGDALSSEPLPKAFAQTINAA